MPGLNPATPLVQARFSAQSPPHDATPPMRPCSRPSNMKGMRMNQLVAPTNFITSISRRRANIAVLMVFQMRATATPKSTTDITMVTVRTKPDNVEMTWNSSSASETPSTLGRPRYCSAKLRTSAASPVSGTTLNCVGIVSGVSKLSKVGSPVKMTFASSKLAALSRYFKLLRSMTAG